MKKIEIVKLSDVNWKKKPSSTILVNSILPLNDEAIHRMLGRIKQHNQNSAIMTVRPKFMSTEANTKVDAAVVDEETPHVLNLYMVQLFDKSCTTASIAELRLRANIDNLN